ncbi:MAG: patatin-like phospholipase family protein [Sulfuricurvum sp.]|nr:patatin-like phospholipase family protein [Sulfuricurvum sp.]
MNEKEIIAAAKALKDRHYYDEALSLLKKMEPDIEIRSSLYRKWVHLKAECIYQNGEQPTSIRFQKALDVLNLLQENDETKRLKGAVYKRKYQNGKNIEDLYRAISYYESAAQNVDDDEGYGAVNAIYLYYALIAHLGDALDVQTIETYKSKVKKIASDALESLEKKYPTTESRQEENREWINPTLAELYLSLYDYEKCNEYLKQSHYKEDGHGALQALLERHSDFIGDMEADIRKAMEIDYGISRKRFTTIEQLIKLYNLLPDHPLNDDEILKSLFNGVEGLSEIDNIISSVRIGKVGLALSGGGFRASLFHIGVLLRLAELDILRHVQVISSVSGGSIIAMHYYLKLKHLLEHNDNFSFGKEEFIGLVREVEKEFIEGIQTNIRMQAFVENNGELTETLGRLYEKQLFARTGDVPDSMNGLYICPKVGKDKKESFKPHFNNFELKNKVPILVINATSLNNGHNWRFTASGMGEVPHMYDMTVDKNKIYEYARYEDFPSEFQKVSIGKAVAASSAVPALFDPINMGKLYGNADTIRLSDGGVYDNQGIAGLVSEECDIMITSDASKQLTEEDDPSDFRFDVLGRIQDILMNKTRDSEFKIAKELRRANRVKGLAILHLKDGFSNKVLHARKHNPDVMENLVTKKDIRIKLANIRTDLDAFHDFEAQALIQSGYEITAHWFDTYGKDQEEWKYFDRNAEKKIKFEKLTAKIENESEKALELLDTSSNVLFKIVSEKIILYFVLVLILILFYKLSTHYPDKVLAIVDFITIAIIALLVIAKDKLKLYSNKLFYSALRPISKLYLACINQIYLDKGKL